METRFSVNWFYVHKTEVSSSSVFNIISRTRSIPAPLPSPPGWDANPSRSYLNIKFASTQLYTWVKRSTERLKCLIHKHTAVTLAPGLETEIIPKLVLYIVRHWFDSPRVVISHYSKSEFYMKAFYNSFVKPGKAFYCSKFIASSPLPLPLLL